MYKFRKIIGKNDFPCHFKKIIVRYINIGYNIDVLRQTACLIVNPIKINNCAYLFNCTMGGSGFRLNNGTILNLLYELHGRLVAVVLGRAYRDLTGGFLLLRNISVAISVSPHVCFILVLILISVFLR